MKNSEVLPFAVSIIRVYHFTVSTRNSDIFSNTIKVYFQYATLRMCNNMEIVKFDFYHQIVLLHFILSFLLALVSYFPCKPIELIFCVTESEKFELY